MVACINTWRLALTMASSIKARTSSCCAPVAFTVKVPDSGWGMTLLLTANRPAPPPCSCAAPSAPNRADTLATRLGQKRLTVALSMVVVELPPLSPPSPPLAICDPTRTTFEVSRSMFR